MSLPINSLYSLTWGDYGTSLVSAVQLLRCHGDLVDVTLAAGGRSFPAHKIVLCAASPFLLDLLKNTPCKHPVVMLAGVNANDLEALLEFVYRGEVSVDHSQLPSLLQAAHCLNIQGLAPQTVSHKDDNTTYTTSIQLHPTLVPQNHQTVKAVIDVGNNVCTEDLITTLTPTQTVQAQVIETITPDQMSDEVTKDVISQFLPTRKRKQRTKKPSQSGGTNATGTITVQSPQASATVSAGGTQAAKVMKTDEEGTIQTIIVNSAEEAANVVKDIKKEASADGASVIDSKDGIIKIKNKSQSEQPATCPICQAVIRQSRNLQQGRRQTDRGKHERNQWQRNWHGWRRPTAAAAAGSPAGGPAAADHDRHLGHDIGNGFPGAGTTARAGRRQRAAARGHPARKRRRNDLAFDCPGADAGRTSARHRKSESGHPHPHRRADRGRHHRDARADAAPPHGAPNRLT
ncbi:hypothetical protein quinque_006027 [Culex quinquefasciatus]